MERTKRIPMRDEPIDLGLLLMHIIVLICTLGALWVIIGGGR